MDESKIQSQTDRQTDRQKTMPIADHTASQKLSALRFARGTCLWTSRRFNRDVVSARRLPLRRPRRPQLTAFWGRKWKRKPWLSTNWLHCTFNRSVLLSTVNPMPHTQQNWTEQLYCATKLPVWFGQFAYFSRVAELIFWTETLSILRQFLAVSLSSIWSTRVPTNLRISLMLSNIERWSD